MSRKQCMDLQFSELVPMDGYAAMFLDAPAPSAADLAWLRGPTGMDERQAPAEATASRAPGIAGRGRIMLRPFPARRPVGLRAARTESGAALG